MEQVKYYSLIVKMGHVGRNKYLPMKIVVSALNKKEAAKVARNHPGVKRNHKDWCLEIPKEINKEEYLETLILYKSDPYWEAKTRQNLKRFKHRLIKETQVKEIKRTPQPVKEFKIRRGIPINDNVYVM